MPQFPCKLGKETNIDEDRPPMERRNQFKLKGKFRKKHFCVIIVTEMIHKCYSFRK